MDVPWTCRVVDVWVDVWVDMWVDVTRRARKFGVASAVDAQLSLLYLCHLCHLSAMHIL